MAALIQLPAIETSPAFQASMANLVISRMTFWKIFKNSQNGSQMTHGLLGTILSLTRPLRIQPRRRERPKSAITAPNGRLQSAITLARHLGVDFWSVCMHEAAPNTEPRDS